MRTHIRAVPEGGADVVLTALRRNEAADHVDAGRAEQRDLRGVAAAHVGQR